MHSGDKLQHVTEKLTISSPILEMAKYFSKFELILVIISSAFSKNTVVFWFEIMCTTFIACPYIMDYLQLLKKWRKLFEYPVRTPLESALKILEKGLDSDQS